MVKKLVETDSDDLQFIIKPSQLVNVGWVLLLLMSFISVRRFDLSFWFMAPALLMWVSKWLIVKCWSFQFHEKTIAERKGVFSVLTREIHYFRIKSIRFEQPFFLRIFGLSNVVLVTSDPLIPMLRVYGIADGTQIKTQIKEQISVWRRERTVKEQDIHPLM